MYVWECSIYKSITVLCVQFSALFAVDAWLNRRTVDGRETLIRHQRWDVLCDIKATVFLSLFYHGSFLILRSSASTVLVVPLTPPTLLVFPASNRVQLMCFIPERTDQGSDVE